jgi:nitrite reductase/ring-hydroxylating ferredoxin subunit
MFVQLRGAEIGVFEHRGEILAYENRCLHQGGPVCEGVILGKVEAILGAEKVVLGERFAHATSHIVCPWHGWEYDVESGRCATDPRLRLRKYEVIERDGNVYLVVPDD